MANIPNKKPAYQGKALSPTTDRQMSQGPATAERTGSVDRSLLPKNEPTLVSTKLNPKRPKQR